MSTIAILGLIGGIIGVVLYTTVEPLEPATTTRITPSPRTNRVVSAYVPEYRLDHVLKVCNCLAVNCLAVATYYCNN
jgi:hypothetical protein